MIRSKKMFRETRLFGLRGASDARFPRLPKTFYRRWVFLPGMARFFMLAVIFLVVTSCVESQIPSSCAEIDLDAYVSYNENGSPLIKHDLAFFYPECVNDLVRAHGIKNFHVATFEERRERFGPAWAEGYQREMCEGRSWRARPPSICEPIS